MKTVQYGEYKILVDIEKTSDYYLAYRLKNADAVTPDLLKSFIDVTVTADDFSCTYSQTHEEQCGPYFYKK